jgi:cytochrome P450
LDGIIYRIIHERHADHADRTDLLSTLLHAQDEDGRQMTDRQLRDEVMTLFLAGHETTAVALAWTWYLLSQHPAEEARLVTELEAVLGGRPPTVVDLPRLLYAESVVKESLRLYPPVWAFARVAVRDCEIGGYPVRAGTSIAMSQWLMHRDGRYFYRPDEFLPERWTDEFVRQLPRFAFFPFSGGPRVCIGSSFAMMESVLLLATMAQQFRLTLAPGYCVELWPTVTLHPRHGMPMVITRRDDLLHLE